MPRPLSRELPNAINSRPESVLRFTVAQLKMAPRNSARASLVADVGRPSLQLDQPIRRFRQNREFGQFSANHCHFITTMKSGTGVAIFINLVWKVLALSD